MRKQRNAFEVIVCAMCSCCKIETKSPVIFGKCHPWNSVSPAPQSCLICGAEDKRHDYVSEGVWK